MTRLRYAVITPVLDEEDNIGRVAECLARQSRVPQAWIVVDTGSSDGTRAAVEALARTHSWIRLESIPPSRDEGRAPPIVRAFHHGLSALPERPEIVVKLDADISFDDDYFSRLLEEFERDPRLGIASGWAYELEDGRWRVRNATWAPVWCPSRAYRRECLEDVLPLEERFGWDTIDLVKATVADWDFRAVEGLPFRHHRPEGRRERTQWSRWVAQGRASHYMGYRFPYLVLRSLYRARRQPAAVGIVAGFVLTALRREPRYPDAAVRQWIRNEQRLRRWPARVREALRRRVELQSPVGSS